MTVGIFGLSTLFALTCCSVRAQWGVRFTLADFDRMSTASIVKWQLGIGIDLETSHRTSIGIDALFDPGIFSPLSTSSSALLKADVTTSPFNGSVGHYDHSTRTFGGQLRSTYFFVDNDEAAPYVAACIGVRSFSMVLKYDYQEVDHSLGPLPYPSTISASKVTVPVCLRFGVRGDLRQFYSDLHVSLGYQVGGGELFDDLYNLRVATGLGDHELVLSRFTYGFGWAFGFGSDGKKVR